MAFLRFLFFKTAHIARFFCLHMFGWVIRGDCSFELELDGMGWDGMIWGGSVVLWHLFNGEI